MPHETAYWLDWSIPEDEFIHILTCLEQEGSEQSRKIADTLTLRAHPLGQYIGDPLPTRQDVPFEDLPL